MQTFAYDAKFSMLFLTFMSGKGELEDFAVVHADYAVGIQRESVVVGHDDEGLTRSLP